MTNKIKAFNKLQRVTSGFQECSILAAAAELDFFTLILESGNRLSANELAEISGSNLRAVTTLLNALAGLGYLLKRRVVLGKGKGKDSVVEYSVAGVFIELLDSRNLGTYIPMIRHLSCVQRSWTELARTVKTGKLSAAAPSILGAEQDEVSYIMAMNSIAVRLAASSVEDLWRIGLLKFKNFIDVGGASGTYSAAFLQALPESRGTLFNLPVGVKAAKKRFTGSEFEGRINLVAGDFMREDLPTGFDFAWISAIIHQFTPEENLILYKKTFNALNAGGVIAVRDFIMNEDKTTPLAGLLFEVTMLAELNTGAVYSFVEIKTALEAVGFEKVEFPAQTETMSSIVTAQKPLQP
ncbi:MAG: hypothetical protein LBJ00_15810 [Planctomycetaceae bacterium]|jgi:hypothetical protein|nr:hypothetical protein [Planctomycetaceae bacterium]